MQTTGIFISDMLLSSSSLLQKAGILEIAIPVLVTSTFSMLAAIAMARGFFTPPGGYKTDGTATLAGTYFFDAYILALIIAVICSTAAIVHLTTPRGALVEPLFWLLLFGISTCCLFCSVTSFVAALAHTSTLIYFPVVLMLCLFWYNKFTRAISVATAQLARIGRKAFLVVSRVVVISLRILAPFWPFAIVFCLVAISTRYEDKLLTWISSFPYKMLPRYIYFNNHQ